MLPPCPSLLRFGRLKFGATTGRRSFCPRALGSGGVKARSISEALDPHFSGAALRPQIFNRPFLLAPPLHRVNEWYTLIRIVFGNAAPVVDVTEPARGPR